MGKPCITCGKARQAQAHRGQPVVEPPAPAISVRPAGPGIQGYEVQIGQNPLLFIGLGVADSLQAAESIPTVVRFEARQLARAIRRALGLGLVNEPKPGAQPVPDEAPHTNGSNGEHKPAHLLQSGTPSVRRSFRSGKVRGLFARATEKGWSWRKGHGGHVIIENPTHTEHIALSTTMSDAGQGRSWANLRAEAKRKGIDVIGL